MHKALRNPNLRIIFGVTLMAVMGVASITPAFPTIMETFHLKPTQVGILIIAFTLPGVFLTPLMGILADRLGRKTILVPSLILFGLAGGAITLTTDFQTVVILRAVQGVGATALGLLNVTLIGDLFEPKQRPEVMGYNASVLSLGTASYPAIGGLLAGLAWYAPFYLPLLAIPIALAVLFWLESPALLKQQPSGVYFRNAWRNINRPYVWKLFVINILTFVILYGSLLSYFPILMRQRYGAPEWQIGLYLSAFSLATAITAFQMKRFSGIFSIRTQLIISLCLYAVAQLIIGIMDNEYLLLAPVMLFGVGQGMLLPAVQTLLVGFAPMRERAVFMSINGMVLRLGQTLGPVVMGAMYVAGGLRWVYLGGALVAVAMLGIWLSTKLPETNANT
jgi:MFS transporter, ACDE family, multidrug resistance protein